MLHQSSRKKLIKLKKGKRKKSFSLREGKEIIFGKVIRGLSVGEVIESLRKPHIGESLT